MLMLIIGAVIGCGVGCGIGALAIQRRIKRGEKKALAEPKMDPTLGALESVHLLIEQIRWLPIRGIQHEKRDDWGYPDEHGIQVIVVEMTGGVNLVGADKGSNRAFLEHNGFRIGLTNCQQKWAGDVLKDRIAEMALLESSNELLALPEGRR